MKKEFGSSAKSEGRGHCAASPSPPAVRKLVIVARTSEDEMLAIHLLTLFVEDN